MKQKRKLKLSVVMPAYNEKKTIDKIIQKVSDIKIPKEIIVVDDGSTDGTREILKNIKTRNIKVVFHKKNRGKGFAVRTGIKHANNDIILIQDADFEYDPEDYYKLIKPISEGKTKVVYGTRFPKGKKRPSIFNSFFWGNRVLTFLSNVLYNAKITDEPTCYKVFDSKVLKSINLKCERFEFCPEVTAKLRKKGHKIYEVPISYYPRTFADGKKINWRDGIEGIWTIIKYRFVN